MTLSPIGNPTGADRPIGVFDSGVGGLSVLNALRIELPQEAFVYFSDAHHAPYGERGDDHVIARTRTIVQELIDAHHIKALVVACNTATAAAIHLVRAEHPDFPVVGVEPALKPAASATRTGHVGVLATRGTLASRKFEVLRDSLQGQARFSLVACDGLAGAIERLDVGEIQALASKYVRALGTFGHRSGEIDTLVLGCTHYPFIAPELQRQAGPEVHLMDTGLPVAQQTRRLLAARDQLATRSMGSLLLETSGPADALEAAASRWLAPLQAPEASEAA
ncbi:glutamate racemase [Variovorax sp. J22R133]|uniref:glutamate racemase n=1 Tax=Variovorax brevis TaxID=3053503 RepID=UPI002578A60F|nr:glutamate racemase [Variovorax sp. J22R133]MDM0112556.1 glutamate racemase [Variovorax sp. J22R133]